MKNEHLVPVMLIQLVENLQENFNKKNKQNEVDNYILRLETIREYIDIALKKFKK